MVQTIFAKDIMVGDTTPDGAYIVETVTPCNGIVSVQWKGLAAGTVDTRHNYYVGEALCIDSRLGYVPPDEEASFIRIDDWY